MSKQQLILAGFLVVIVAAGLPAFVLSGNPEGDSTNQSVTSRTSSESILADQVPETTLNLNQTTKAERQQIKRRRKVNINTADSAALESIPNIGPNRAKAILKLRKSGFVFRNKRDLNKIQGFGDKRAADLAKHVKYGKENYKEPTSTSGKININEANQSQLESLPGVGKVTARRILDYRDQHGDFQTYSDLNKVSGVGMGTIDNFADQIKGLSGDLSSSSESGSSVSGTVNINTAGKSELDVLPGVGPATAQNILDYRATHGEFGSVDELDAVDGIGTATLADIRPRATVE